ncbi:MAG TPA: hypothetical protein VFM18_07475, partial [Methanosarcina sp.]|nr:hypothetical protein [Methanosarcina sp.]
MFNVSLFVALCLLASLACLALFKELLANYSFSTKIQAIRVKLILFSFSIRKWLLAVIAGLVGCHTAPLVGLSAPFLELLVAYENPTEMLLTQTFFAIVGAIVVSFGLYF